MFPFNDMMETSTMQRNEAVSGLSSRSTNTTLQAHKKSSPTQKANSTAGFSDECPNYEKICLFMFCLFWLQVID